MVAKVASLGIFLIFAIFMFNAGIFTADFWGNVYNNAVAAGEMALTLPACAACSSRS